MHNHMHSSRLRIHHVKLEKILVNDCHHYVHVLQANTMLPEILSPAGQLVTMIMFVQGNLL